MQFKRLHFDAKPFLEAWKFLSATIMVADKNFSFTALETKCGLMVTDTLVPWCSAIEESMGSPRCSPYYLVEANEDGEFPEGVDFEQEIEVCHCQCPVSLHTWNTGLSLLIHGHCYGPH
jgi:hypothetical protein